MDDKSSNWNDLPLQRLKQIEQELKSDLLRIKSVSSYVKFNDLL